MDKHVGPSRRSLQRIRDGAFAIPGTRFKIGLDPIVGLLLPGSGDAIGGLVALVLLFLGLQYRLPVWVIARMVMNIGLDAAIGGIPIAGDLFDFVWKSNEKNLRLIERHRARPGAPMPFTYWLAVAALLFLALASLVAPIVLVVWLVAKWRH
jgi:hypothetical protein